QQRRGGFGQPVRGVYKSQITPHWMADKLPFWGWHDLRGGAKEFILVDAAKGSRRAAFDHRKLASALSRTANEEYKADRLPFSDIEFINDGKTLPFNGAGKTWRCDLNSYECPAQAGTETKPAA